MDIGNKIKQIRLQRGLTQGELAERCELTKGYISQLENDLSSPSIATLIDILNILGVTPSAFFTEEKAEKTLFSKNDYFVTENEGYNKIWLIPNSQKNEMEPVIVELADGAATEIRYPFEGEEFGYVLEGRIIIETEKEKYRAKRGESFYIDGRRQHRLINNGKTVAKVLWVATPSNF